MGAYTALRVGMTHPERVRSVIFSAGGSGAEPAGREGFLEETLRVADLLEETGVIPAEAFGSGPTRVQLKKKQPETWERFVGEVAEHPAFSAALILRNVQSRRLPLYDYEEELKSFDRPLLCMLGDEDEPCLNVSLWLKRLISSARLMVMPNSGHAVNLEEPEAFNAAMISFLDEVEEGRWYPRPPEARRASLYLPEPS